MGGGGGPTQSTVTQSNLPEYAKPYYTTLMKRAEKESKTEYIPYPKERIAPMSNATRTSLNMAGQYGRSDTGVDPVVGTLGDVASRAGGLNYAGSNYAAERLGTQNFDATARDQYMSPYMDAVVNRAQQNALDQFYQQQATRNLDAAKAGSFGGSRAAVQNAIAQNQLNNNLTDIFVQGQQSAFENAQSQFNTDQARQLEAAARNQQATFDAANLNEQSRQFGANYGLQGLDLQRSAAMDQLSALGQRDAMTQQRIQAMLGAGQTREDYKQRRLDQRYADFVNQRDAERQNLQFLSSILQGVPISPNREIVSTTSQNNIAGLLGSLGGLQSLQGMQQS